MEFAEDYANLHVDEVISKYYDISHVKPASIPWLPQPIQSTSRNPNDHGIFSKIKNQPYHEGLWDIVQNSVPPFFAKKYHAVNIMELVKGRTDVNYMSIASCFCMWNECLGLPLMKLIVNQHTSYKSTSERYKKTTKYNDIMLGNIQSIIRYLKFTLTGIAITTPTSADLCTKASEFLLEPCIHIQLPWKPVLLHQWLTAAYTEVLMFERDSVEFRHWLLTEEVLALTEGLLSLVRHLKERIMLGFTILNRQINLHPQFDPKLPDLILDDVVIPSIPILQYLISGKAHKMLKLIKIYIFTDSDYDNSKAIHSMPLSAYCLDENLSEFHVKFCYNFHMWNEEKLGTPFPEITKPIHDILERLRTNSTKPFDYDYIENKLVLDLSKNKSSIYHKLDSQQKIDLALKTVKEQLIDTNKVPGEIWPQIQNILKSPEVKKHTEDLFDDSKLGFTHHVIRWALIFNVIRNHLLDFDSEKSVMAQIITLQLKTLQKETLLKLSVLICTKFSKCPLPSQQYDCVNKVDLESLSQQINEVNIKVNQQNRDIFWSQFPYAWKKPVNINEKDTSDFDLEDTNKIIEVFENRIGRLIYNIAKESFVMNSKSVESFADWNTIQYILPCIVATYIEETKRCWPQNIHMLEYIHEVIQAYEMRYHKWITECKPREIISTEEPSIMEEMESAMENYFSKSEWLCLNLKIRENARLVLGVNIMHIQYITTITGIDQILNYLHDWPTNVTYLCSSLSSVDFLKILGTWWLKTFKFTEHLLHIGVKWFKIPKPGTQFKQCKKLGALYQTSVILSELEIVFELAKYNSSKNSVLKIEVENAVEGMKQHRYDILKGIMDLIMLGGMHGSSTKELDQLVAAKKDIELDLYMKLKKFRKQCGKLKFKLFDFLPYSTLYPDLKPAVTHYLKGDFVALEEMLPIFEFPKAAVEKPSKSCRQCGKKEGVKKFVTCEKCVKEKYPDVNYFCGRRCQDARWKSEHMAEHLEFELGLVDVANLNLGKK